jgi:hypothetical protein
VTACKLLGKIATKFESYMWVYSSNSMMYVQQ